jgi:xanthine dehydrogenase accessory factor
MERPVSDAPAAPFDPWAAIAALRAEGRRFAVATVVRTEDATSAKAGAKAVVTETGEILGHLGGACVQRAVREAAAEAVAGGETRLIRVRPASKVVALTDPDGAQVFRSGCPSGGSAEILIEACAAAPRLCVLGGGMVARAVAEFAARMGWRVAVEAAPAEGLTLAPCDFAVIATQGKGDGHALRAAVASDAGWIGMVASRRKAAALLGKLAAEGAPADRLARVESPAGVDIGAVEPEEIALSIMAAATRARRRPAARPVAERRGA